MPFCFNHSCISLYDNPVTPLSEEDVETLVKSPSGNKL